MSENTQPDWKVLTVVMVLITASIGVVWLSSREPQSIDADTSEPADISTSFSGEPLTIEDIPKEHRDIVVSKSEQERTEKWYSNYISKSESSDVYREWGESKPQGKTLMKEFTRYPKKKVTLAQINRSWVLYNKSYTAADREDLFNISSAEQKGYKRFDHLHWANLEYLYDNQELSPYRVESLLYEEAKVTLPNGTETVKLRLAGVMYLRKSFGHGKQIGGPLTAWHSHLYDGVEYCPGGWMAQRIVEKHGKSNVPDGAFTCDVKSSNSVETIHVWFEKRPRGPFVSEMQAHRSPPAKYDKMNRSEFINYTLDSYENNLKDTRIVSDE